MLSPLKEEPSIVCSLLDSKPHDLVDVYLMLLELTAGLVVILIAFTPDLRDWGTSSNRPNGHPHEPLARWRAPRLGPRPKNTVLYCTVLAGHQLWRLGKPLALKQLPTHLNRWISAPCSDQQHCSVHWSNRPAGQQGSHWGSCSLLAAGRALGLVMRDRLGASRCKLLGCCCRGPCLTGTA